MTAGNLEPKDCQRSWTAATVDSGGDSAVLRYKHGRQHQEQRCTAKADAKHALLLDDFLDHSADSCGIRRIDGAGPRVESDLVRAGIEAADRIKDLSLLHNLDLLPVGVPDIDRIVGVNCQT